MPLSVLIVKINLNLHNHAGTCGAVGAGFDRLNPRCFDRLSQRRSLVQRFVDLPISSQFLVLSSRFSVLSRTSIEHKFADLNQSATR